MSWTDDIVEQCIAEAIARGDFDGLSGAGKPVHLDDDSNVPEELRLAYRVLKNAGYVPAEVSIRKEIAEIESWLGEGTSRRHRAARRRLAVLRASLRGSGRGELNLALEGGYHRQLLARLEGSKSAQG